jgi:GNAT superfamily N-acetyltransferase
MIQVRDAELMDLASIGEMLAQATAEGAFLVDSTPLDMSRAADTITALLRDEDALRLVMDGNGRAVGALFATIEPHPWCSVYYTNVALLYVAPAYRTAKLFDALLEVLEEYAAQHEAVPALQVTSGLHIDAMDRLMTMKGYTPIGAHYARGEPNVRRAH